MMKKSFKNLWKSVKKQRLEGGGLGAAGGYLQEMMEKFSPTFFSQFLIVDFENLRYTGQICMKRPYFGLYKSRDLVPNHQKFKFL